MVSGTLFNTTVLLVNIYAPKLGNEDFISSVISFHLIQTHTIFLICTIDPTNLDKSSSKQNKASKWLKLCVHLQPKSLMGVKGLLYEIL